MSDNQQHDNTSAVVPTNGVATSSQKPLVATQQPIVIEQQSGGKGIATGALILSLIALGASGFLFVQGQNVFQQQQLFVKQELDNAALGESENARKLANSLDEQVKLNQIVSQLDAGAQQNRNHIADVQRGYQELLKGRVNWLVDEVEVTLNLASQQLLLSGNVPVAITVLESIEQRLSRFEQSDLLPIKKAISADLAALKARPYLDVSGTVLKLDGLEKGVPALPLLVDSALQESTPQTDNRPVAGDSFWSQTWDKTVHVLKDMVEIRKLDSNDAMLLAPEQIYFVRSNLRLRLLDARLALLQHNGEVYKNNLNAIESTVKQYFDVHSPTTQKWLSDLNTLKNLDIHMVSDDALKESQTAVRNYQNNARTATPVNLKAIEPLAPATLKKAQPTVLPSVSPASVPTTTDKSTASEPDAITASIPKVNEASAAAATATVATTTAVGKALIEDKKANEIKNPVKSTEKKSDNKKTDEKKADSAGKSQTSKQVDVLATPTIAAKAVAESASHAELVKPTPANRVNPVSVSKSIVASKKVESKPEKKSAPQAAKTATKTTKTAPQTKKLTSETVKPKTKSVVKPQKQPEKNVSKLPKNLPAVTPKTPKKALSQNIQRAMTPQKQITKSGNGIFLDPKYATRFANVEVVQPRPVLQNKIERLETFGGKRDPVLRDLNTKKAS